MTGLGVVIGLIGYYFAQRTVVPAPSAPLQEARRVRPVAKAVIAAQPRGLTFPWRVFAYILLILLALLAVVFFLGSFAEHTSAPVGTAPPLIQKPQDGSALYEGDSTLLAIEVRPNSFSSSAPDPKDCQRFANGIEVRVAAPAFDKQALLTTVNRIQGFDDVIKCVASISWVVSPKQVGTEAISVVAIRRSKGQIISSAGDTIEIKVARRFDFLGTGLTPISGFIAAVAPIAGPILGFIQRRRRKETSNDNDASNEGQGTWGDAEATFDDQM